MPDEILSLHTKSDLSNDSYLFTASAPLSLPPPSSLSSSLPRLPSSVTSQSIQKALYNDQLDDLDVLAGLCESLELCGAKDAGIGIRGMLESLRAKQLEVTAPAPPPATNQHASDVTIVSLSDYQRTFGTETLTENIPCPAFDLIEKLSIEDFVDLIYEYVSAIVPPGHNLAIFAFHIETIFLLLGSRGGLPRAAVLGGILYLGRIVNTGKIILTEDSVFLWFFTCMMLSFKFLQDRVFNSNDWKLLAGNIYTLEQIRDAELTVLRYLHTGLITAPIITSFVEATVQLHRHPARCGATLVVTRIPQAWPLLLAEIDASMTLDDFDVVFLNDEARNNLSTEFNLSDVRMVFDTNQ